MNVVNSLFGQGSSDINAGTSAGARHRSGRKKDRAEGEPRGQFDREKGVSQAVRYVPRLLCHAKVKDR